MSGKDWADVAWWGGAVAVAVLIGAAAGLYGLAAYVMVAVLVAWAWKRS